MKTTNYLRNAALTLMLALCASAGFGQGEIKTPDNLSREKTEFANAGYWIDAVVVSAVTEKSDREILADKGYYIEPVVVTYSSNVQDFIDTPDANVFFTPEQALENLEVSMLFEDQAR